MKYIGTWPASGRPHVAGGRPINVPLCVACGQLDLLHHAPTGRRRAAQTTVVIFGPSPSLVRRTPERKPAPPRVGATSPKPGYFGLAPISTKQWYPLLPLPTTQILARPVQAMWNGR